MKCPENHFQYLADQQRKIEHFPFTKTETTKCIFLKCNRHKQNYRYPNFQLSVKMLAKMILCQMAKCPITFQALKVCIQRFLLLQWTLTGLSKQDYQSSFFYVRVLKFNRIKYLSKSPQKAVDKFVLPTSRVCSSAPVLWSCAPSHPGRPMPGLLLLLLLSLTQLPHCGQARVSQKCICLLYLSPVGEIPHFSFFFLYSHTNFK